MSAQKLKTEVLEVTGMGCSSCSLKVENLLNKQEGVIEAKVNFASKTVLIHYDPKITQIETLKSATKDIGYDLIAEDSEASNDVHLKEYQKIKTNTIGAATLAIPVVILGMFFMHLPYVNWIMLILTIPVVIFFGQQFYVSAFRQLKHFSANMDTLVAVSTAAAFLFSLFNTIFPEFWTRQGLEVHVYYEAVAATIAFILAGKLLEEKAKSKTSSALKKLIGLQPKTVIKIESDGSEKIIPIKEVKVGDILSVKPGDKIPVDGMVHEGNSFVDESTITGEPIPNEKYKGQKVFAGTINQKGNFSFIAEKVGNKTVLAQIIKMVQEAQGSKAPVQKLVDKVASVFVPVVIGISILTFAIWMLVGGEQAFTHALLTSISVLVIACPCALGLATPTAIMVGIGKGAEHNILIKDAESLELAKKVNVVILDKTGTITEGKPIVTDLIWFENNEPDKTKSYLSAIEKKSEHPLASAVVEKLTEENIKTISIENFQSITGKGVSAIIQGENYYVGNKQLLKDHNILTDNNVENNSEKLQQEAKTVIYFANDKKVLAIIAISDKIKTTSLNAIKKLHETGKEVYMLTGDNIQTAKAVASQIGIQNYKAEMMPSDKAAFIIELQKKGHIVAMVGDGINDSHALAQADVSIAMGKGSDIAMDVAKITLITSDLNLIHKAFSLSRQTVATIKQNLFWAFIYNVIGIPIAAGILYSINGFLLNPMIAAAAMAFSSVSVVLNSLRLNFKKL